VRSCRQAPSGLASAAFLAIAVALAACQPLPQPFAPEGPNPLLGLPDGGGVVVGTVTGLHSGIAEEIRAAMRDALLRTNVPATTGPGNKASYRLTAVASAGPLALTGRTTELRVVWHLAAPDGQELASIDRSMAVQAGEVGALSRAVMADLATRVAETIRAAARPGAGTPDAERLAVSVLAVEGASGDGGTSLTRSLARSLRTRGIRVVEEFDPTGLLVFGDVMTSPAREGRQQVTINWMVQWADGRGVGTVSQSNAVPAGMLDRHWGDVAAAVADAAAAGIVDLIDKAEAERARAPIAPAGG